MGKLPSFLRQHDGKLTREMLLSPAGFGLGRLPEKGRPDATTTMVCGFCSTGCGLNVHLREGEAIGLSPSRSYPVNLGMACPKGWEALSPLGAPDRATHPLLRRGGRMDRVTWDEALTELCSRMKAVMEEHGPESVAFLGTGQIVTEELAFLGALAKIGMGLVHGDANTRQCMATSAVAYKQSFGFDAPPFTYADLEQSDVIVLVGSNLCIAHPILWERVLRNPGRPHIVVIDPRRTETASAATLHLPLRPKSDLTLFHAIARELIARGRVDRAFVDAHTSGFDAFAAHVEPISLERAERETGLPLEDLRRLVSLIEEGERVSFWWTMGVNQSHEGVRTAQALVNLALMTGNIGRPGTGANSITGQCNAMGSRLFSNTSSLLGGRDFKNPAHRGEVADILGVDVARIPTSAGLAYNEIIQRIKYGSIKALWVIGTNPAHSWIQQTGLREAFERLELLVVQDMYHSTETARMAHLVLPAAGWGEKDGTFINSERRIGLAKKVSRAPGEALTDFSIFRLIADYWGCGDLFSSWTTPEDVFRTLQDLSRGRPCDFSGIEGYAAIDAAGGIQWPCPAGTEGPAPERRLFEDGRFFHEDGRARFLFDRSRPMPEQPDDEYPFLLLTGRSSAAEWHTRTRTGKSAVLRTLTAPSLHVEIHPLDAARLGIEPGTSVAVESRRGSLSAVAFVTESVQPGHVFLPMHFEATNRLTLSVFDPHSKQPAYKACAVRVTA
jgi:anaerobic selenocysteine-containing dehydrogenase